MTHNHEPSTDIVGHPSFRRLSPQDIENVKNMTLSGIPPRQILSSLRQGNQSLPAISRTIYNLKAKIRKENLNNRSMVSALFEEFEKEGHFEHARSTINLLCIWHIEKNVLANCKKHFEHAEEFDIFMSSWNNVAYSTTTTIFEHNWGEFELVYQTKKVVTEYIKNTWFPWKEKFVSAWTENYLHFGNRVSSRAEGAHAKLKLYLQVSTGGFQEVKEKICLAIKHEFNEIKVKLASQRMHVFHICDGSDGSVFGELLYYVSHFALKKIHMQFEKLKKGTINLCTCHFMATMGLPCAHKIKHLQRKPISLDLIHPHWRIDTLRLRSEDDSQTDGATKFDELFSELSSRYHSWPLNKKEFVTSKITKLLNETDVFFEPMIRRPKGRPPKAKKKRERSSTTRDPSKFELVELSQRPKASSSTSKNNLPDLNVYPKFSSNDMPY